MSHRRKLSLIADNLDLLACKIECVAAALRGVEQAVKALAAALTAKPVGIGVEVGTPVPRTESPEKGVP